MPSGNPVTIYGLRETQKRLKELGAVEGSRELKAGLKAAAEIVAKEAARRVPIGPARKGHTPGAARESIKPGFSGQKAFVSGGRKSVRYYGWLDFGSRNPKSGRPRSVGPWKGSGRGPAKGRFIYAALDDKWDEVREAVEKAVGRLRDGTGLQS